MTLTQLTVGSDWLTPICSTTEQYKHIKACTRQTDQHTIFFFSYVLLGLFLLQKSGYMKESALMCLYCSVVLQVGVSQSDSTVSCVNVISVLWPF